MEIVLVNTPPIYGQKLWVDNIAHMLERTGTKYDVIHVIDDIVFGGVYDKLRLFDYFKTNQYLYLDLDLIITGNIEHLVRDEFTLLDAWWRPQYHTPLNSSIMSWSGDCSYIFEKFNEDPDYYMVKYNRGIDEFIWKEVEYNTYGMVCDSYNWDFGTTGQYPVTLYNQARHHIWKHPSTLLESEIDTTRM